MFEERVNGLKAINWTVLPKVLYSNVIFPMLSYADLVVFSRSDQSGQNEKEFCKTLAEAHLSRFFVLTPPTSKDPHRLLCKYAPIDDTRKAFLAKLITTPDFDPEEINLDDYKLIGIKIDDKKLPARVFSPLHYLYETGNQKLLDKIYAKAKIENNDGSLFYKNYCTSLLRCYLETEALDAIKLLLTKTQLAIATYQPIAEIERLYKALEEIAGEHFEIIFNALHDYAQRTINTAAFDYFDMRAPINQDLFATCERKGFDLDLLVDQFKGGANPLYLLAPCHTKTTRKNITETNIKNLTTAMFWFCDKKEEDNKKEQTREAIKQLQHTFTF